jgi:uncharacterized membrane protein required for colicin V production
MDKLSKFSLSWVDVLVAVMLLVGIIRGRKRGMSEELLDIIKWGAILAAAALLYAPLGQLLSQISFFSLLSCYVTVYALIMLLLLLVFSMIRHSVGDKLVGSDTFGRAEYYLGMMAGMVRYGCIILVGMAFLNARYYSPAEVQAKSKYQQDNFGSSFFLTLPDLQNEVFVQSLSGRIAHDYLSVALIRPTAGSSKELNEGDNIARRREKAISDIMDKKKR